MNETIAIISLAVLFILAIIRTIEWRDLAVKWVGNNPKNAQIYIEAGDTTRTVVGKRILEDATNGDKYDYKEGKEMREVVLPADYPYKYIRGRRIIGISDGKVVANPLGFVVKTKENQEKYTESPVSISTNTLMHFVKLIKSVQQSKAVNWTMLLIAAVAGIAVMWFYQNYMAQPAEPAPAANQPAANQPATFPPSDKEIVVK